MLLKSCLPLYIHSALIIRRAGRRGSIDSALLSSVDFGDDSLEERLTSMGFSNPAEQHEPSFGVPSQLPMSSSTRLGSSSRDQSSRILRRKSCDEGARLRSQKAAIEHAGKQKEKA